MDVRTHLALCESVARATDRMLQAARGADWDALVTAEQACALLVDRLRHDPVTASLDAEERARKAALIRRMLANDREIRDITRPELARLDRLLGPSRREAELRRAYGPASG